MELGGQNGTRARVTNDGSRLERRGFAGLVGSGRTELARAIFGADRIAAGTIALEGKPIAPASPADATSATTIRLAHKGTPLISKPPLPAREYYEKSRLGGRAGLAGVSGVSESAQREEATKAAAKTQSAMWCLPRLVALSPSASRNALWTMCVAVCAREIDRRRSTSTSLCASRPGV